MSVSVLVSKASKSLHITSHLKVSLLKSKSFSLLSTSLPCIENNTSFLSFILDNTMLVSAAPAIPLEPFIFSKTSSSFPFF